MVDASPGGMWQSCRDRPDDERTDECAGRVHGRLAPPAPRSGHTFWRTRGRTDNISFHNRYDGGRVPTVSPSMRPGPGGLLRVSAGLL